MWIALSSESSELSWLSSFFAGILATEVDARLGRKIGLMAKEVSFALPMSSSLLKSIAASTAEAMTLVQFSLVFFPAAFAEGFPAFGRWTLVGLVALLV